MKKKIIVALFAIAACNVNMAQDQLRKIPAEVTSSFAEKFPTAINTEWQDQLVDVEVSFDKNGKSYRARFANNGDWKITERIIKKDFLPTSVVKGFTKGAYSKWEIEEVTIIETPENKTQFKITVAKNTIIKKGLLYNTEGKLVKDNFTF